MGPWKGAVLVRKDALAMGTWSVLALRQRVPQPAAIPALALQRRYLSLQEPSLPNLTICATSEQYWEKVGETYSSKSLIQERTNSNMPLTQNETFLLSLLPNDLPSGQGGSDQAAVQTHHLPDTILKKYLTKCVHQVGTHRFSPHFFELFASRLAQASPRPQSAQELADLMCRRFLKPNGSTTTLGAAEVVDPLQIASIFGKLFKGLSHAGCSERIHNCFHALRANKIPLELKHYQYELIAMSNMRTKQAFQLAEDSRSRNMTRNQLDNSQLIAGTDNLQEAISELKAYMDEDKIEVDDQFLATVVMVLSAPLRHPLRLFATVKRTKAALDIVRAIGAQAFPTSRDGAITSQHTGKSRLFSALISIELASLRSVLFGKKTRASLLNKLGHGSSANDNHQTSVASFPAALQSMSLSPLNSTVTRLRLAEVQNDLQEALTQLQCLLDWDLEACESAKVRRDILLKQRSAVISLFSMACSRRSREPKRDPCLQVIELAVQHPRFKQTWRHIQLPANQSPFLTEKDCDPRLTLARLWKRWFRAWSIDVVSYNSVMHPKDKTDSDCRANLSPTNPRLHRTYTGQNPWKTLTRGSKLFTQTLDQLEEMSSDTAEFSQDDNKTKELKEFAHIFNEKTCLDVIIRIALRGGRNPVYPEQYNEVQSVQARLNHIFQLLERVQVRPLIWDRVEASLLNNFSRMEDTRLTTDQIKIIINDVRSRRGTAKQRSDWNLLHREQSLYQRRREKESDPSSNDDEFEPASIFVLRNLILNK